MGCVISITVWYSWSPF